MKIINYILLALLLISVGVVAWFYYNPKIEKVYVQIKPKAEIIYIEKSDGGNIATVPIFQSSKPTEVLSDGYIKYIDTVTQALNKGLKYKLEVQRLTKVNAVLKDSLSRKDLIIQTTNNNVIAWRTKYIEIETNVKDSTAKYTYNAQLDIIDYDKKESLFGKRKQFIAVTSPDKNLRINDVENYSKEIKTPKDFLELNLKIQGLYLDKTLVPYGGAELLFNPDGKLKPIVGYGYFYQSNKLYPYFLAGLQFNLLRF